MACRCSVRVEILMTYLEWNDCLAEHFFSPAKAGRKVHLFATHELIENLGHPSGDGFQGFVEAVKAGPPWAHRNGLCQRALEALAGWRAKGRELPPYIAYLALFVIAAGLEEDFPPHAYYPRLRKVLGEDPESGHVPSFDKMLALWDDLEHWSNVDQEGERGVFQTRVLGSWIYVGVPRAQTLLSEEELHRLPLIFARAGLDPTTLPSEREIPQVVLAEGRSLLRKRTVCTLKSMAEPDAEVRQALIDVILEELREWSGETFDATGDGGVGARHLTGAVRLCCDLDRTAGWARTSFRCRMPGEFPEEGLALRSLEGRPGGVGKDVEITCEEWGRGWSSPLESGDGVVDASRYDWENNIQFEAIGCELRFHFSGSPVRILMDGSGEGLPGLVEVRRLPSQSKFYLLAKQDDAERLAAWGAGSCDGWKELSPLRGLPVGWRAFSADKGRNDEGIRNDYPSIALPVNVSLSLQGGIRVGRGNRYFDFAPPSVTVEGANVEQLLFNEVDAGHPNVAGQFDILHDLPTLTNEAPDRVLIEARRGGQTLARLALYLARGGWSWTGASEGLRLASFGQPIAADVGSPTVRGAETVGITAPDFNFASAMPLAEHGSIHYVGRAPGQIVHWPSEPMPEEWSPVWVVVSRRRGQVIFCGTNPRDAQPVRGQGSDRKKLKIWKDFLWVRRKQLQPPVHASLRNLWQQYLEAARNV